MANKVMTLEDILLVDQLGTSIAERWLEWDTYRNTKKQEWKEIQQYVFATDTTMTSNAKLPWSNKTTIPKLCQIRDNLLSNYIATMFPKRKWVIWEADTDEDAELLKKESIEAYISWVVSRAEFRTEVTKLVADFIDYGNVFATTEWVDRSVILEDGRKQAGYVGPVIRRINPLDIVFNPTAPSFDESPKIVRSIVSLGELKELLSRESVDMQEREDAMALYNYLLEYRKECQTFEGDLQVKDDIFSIAGFDSYRSYLESGNCEILTFYGDLYDAETDTLYKNHIIKVVDRHKVISKKPNPSLLGLTPIYHAGWRVRPDNLWAMGPLDNLVGMQYRIDHLENMKADVFDLIAYPPLKIKGYVEDFKWGPFERIITSEDGDVELMSPDVQALNADNQIAILENKMEEMAGSPREAMGIRSPGEKTAYEIQRMENATARIFQNKISSFEMEITERCLNSMLDLAKRMMGPTTIRIFDDELMTQVFMELTPNDIAGLGRVKPVAARNYAEKATMVQNLANFYGSASAADPTVKVHFSGYAQAKMWEQLLDIDQYKIVQQFVGIIESADAARLQNTVQEQVLMEQQTAAGITPGDHDPEEVTPDMQGALGGQSPTEIPQQ